MKINELVTQYNELKKQITNKLEAELALLFDELLKDQDEVQSFSWTQYTPYFNDGVECVFWVNSSYLDVNKINYYYYDFTSISNKITREVSTILRQIPDDIMLEVFGDHVEVTFVKNEGFTTEVYEHD